ncbi:hypothetical protein ACA910_011512 [Epithemia clementina (nom. ined.)]
MPETPAHMSSISPYLEEEQDKVTDDQVFTHVVEKVLMIKPVHVRCLQNWTYYHGMDTFGDVIDMISLMLDQQVQDLQSYKRGKTRYDLPTVILAKLHLITIWALNQMTATKTLVPASLWMKLTNNEFDQWCIASNYELPADDANLVTPASLNMTSTFFDIADDNADWNLASLFELPVDGALTSTFVDITDDFDHWNLASLFDLPDYDTITSTFMDITNDFDQWDLASFFALPTDNATIVGPPASCIIPPQHYFKTPISMDASASIIQIRDCHPENLLLTGTPQIICCSAVCIANTSLCTLCVDPSAGESHSTSFCNVSTIYVCSKLDGTEESPSSFHITSVDEIIGCTCSCPSEESGEHPNMVEPDQDRFLLHKLLVYIQQDTQVQIPQGILLLQFGNPTMLVEWEPGETTPESLSIIGNDDPTTQTTCGKKHRLLDETDWTNTQLIRTVKQMQHSAKHQIGYHVPSTYKKETDDFSIMNGNTTEHSTISLSPDNGNLFCVYLYDTGHCPYVDKPLGLYHHGKSYNMVHIATLTTKLENNNGTFDRHLCETSHKQSYDVINHCKKDSSPDCEAHHTKTQESIHSEYFAAFNHLEHISAQKEHFNNKVACQHGEKEYKCMEQPDEEKAPNKTFEYAEQYSLKHYLSPLHPHAFRIPTIHKYPLMTKPCKVTLDEHLGNPNIFHRTLRFSPDNLADDDPIITTLYTTANHSKHLLYSSSPSHQVDIVSKPPKPPNLYGALPIFGDILSPLDTSIIIGSKLWGAIITDVPIMVGNNLWGDTSTPIGMPLLEKSITITIGNNLWGDTNTATDMHLFDDEGIFMVHHDWGGCTTQNNFFDFTLHNFYFWHKTPNITQGLAYLDGAFMSQVDWGDINTSFCQSNSHYLFLYQHVHQVIAHIKWFASLHHVEIPSNFYLFTVVWVIMKSLFFWCPADILSKLRDTATICTMIKMLLFWHGGVQDLPKVASNNTKHTVGSDTIPTAYSGYCCSSVCVYVCVFNFVRRLSPRKLLV